jgi:hypothetical protein
MWFSRSVRAFTLCSSVRAIVRFQCYSSYGGIIISIKHPASLTSIVYYITVKQLLDRIFLNSLITTTNSCQRLESGSSSESPAWSTGFLVIWSWNFPCFKPVNIVWNNFIDIIEERNLYTIVLWFQFEESKFVLLINFIFLRFSILWHS